MTDRVAKTSLILLVCGCLSGCLQVDQQLTLNADGSGLFTFTYGIATETLRQMEAARKTLNELDPRATEAAPEADALLALDAARLRRRLEDLAPLGVTVRAVDESVSNGWKFIHAACAFTNLRVLAESAFFESSSFSLVRRANDQYVMTQRAGSYGRGDMPDPLLLSDAVLAQMAPLLKGLVLDIRFTAPGRILESNGRFHGPTAHWHYDIETDPLLLSHLRTAQLRVVFEGGGAPLPEIRPVAEQGNNYGLDTSSASGGK